MCIHGEGVVWEGPALCWLCPDIHSHTTLLYTAGKEGIAGRPLHTDQRGVGHAAVSSLERLPTWKYHIAVLGGGGPSVIVSCQTSRVLLTASYLTFSLRQIYFSFFGIWAVAPLVTKFSSLFPTVCSASQWQQACGNCTFVWKENVTPIKKRSHEATDEQAPVSYQFMIHRLGFMRPAVEHLCKERN